MRGVEMLRRCPVGGEQAQDTQPLLGGQLACWLNHFLNKWICWATWSSSGYREQYGSTHKATVSMDKLFELNFAQFATKKTTQYQGGCLPACCCCCRSPRSWRSGRRLRTSKGFKRRRKRMRLLIISLAAWPGIFVLCWNHHCSLEMHVALPISALITIESPRSRHKNLINI